jgi:hypothetical protein
MKINNIIKLANIFGSLTAPIYKTAIINQKTIEDLKKELLDAAKLIIEENISKILSPLYSSKKVAMEKPQRLLELYMTANLPIVDQSYDYQASKIILYVYIDKALNKNITEEVERLGINTTIKNLLVQIARNKFPGSEDNLPSIIIPKTKVLSMYII